MPAVSSWCLESLAEKGGNPPQCPVVGTLLLRAALDTLPGVNPGLRAPVCLDRYAPAFGLRATWKHFSRESSAGLLAAPCGVSWHT